MRISMPVYHQSLLTINEQVDSFSAIALKLSTCSLSDSDSEEEVDSALETTMKMIPPTRLGRVRTVTSRMADFLEAGMWSGRNLSL